MEMEWWQILLTVLGALLTTVFLVILYSVHRVPKLKLRGKSVLVTGGSAGIGLALAKELTKRGAIVVIAARGEDALKSAVAEITAEVKVHSDQPLLPANTPGYVRMDVSDAQSVRQGIAAGLAHVGRVRTNATAPTDAAPSSFDVVVCCAGFSHPSRFLDCSAEMAKKMMDINYFGCTNVVREVLPAMVDRRSGRVVLVSSMASAAAVAGFTNYAPTKAAVRAFAQALDMEYAAMGVRTQVVNPPDVDTPGYELENKVKSPECVEICAMGGGKPYSPQAMASALVEGIETYRFQVNLGFDGVLLGHGTAGMEPASSACDLVIQCCCGGVVRLVGAVYTKLHYGIVQKVRAREAAAGSK